MLNCPAVHVTGMRFRVHMWGRERFALAILTTAIVVTGCTGLESSPVKVTNLAPPDATHAYGFTNLTSVVELRGGDVMVSDPREGGLYYLGPGLEERRMVGSSGNGPLQYVNAVSMLQFAEDSVLHLDRLALRGLIIARDSVVAQLSATESLLETRSSVAGADSMGNVLQLMAVRLDPSGSVMSIEDSLRLVLRNRRTGDADTIGMLRPQVPLSPGKSSQPYFIGEQAFLGIDGWIAVVRVEPYRVDWRSPDGSWRLGEPIGVQAIQVDEAERAFYLRHTGADRASASWQATIDWPDKIPPVGFQMNQPLTRNGMVVLRRQVSSRAPEGLYDVIDRHGRLVNHLQLVVGQRILGFGAESVYLVTTDEDGLQYLSRHEWR